MKVRSAKEVEAFKDAINHCSKAVWLESSCGDKYDMKSTMSQYIGIAKLLEDEQEDLELFASAREDQVILMDFISKLGS